MNNKTRCNKHKMYWNPCPICAEIDQLKTNKSLAEWNVKKLEEEIDQIKETVSFLEEDNKEMESAIEELTDKLDKATPIKEFADPKFLHRLYNKDINLVRGLLVSTSFLYNTIVAMGDRIPEIKDEKQKHQWKLIHNEISQNWNRATDIASILTGDMSKSNWNRLVKETATVVENTVELMNDPKLGHWSVSDSGEYNKEYDITKLTTEALDECIASSGTNKLTEYSKQILLKKLIKIVEEK